MVYLQLLQEYNHKPVEIWMKALEWNKGGTISTIVNGKNSSINLFSPDQRFGLYKIYEGISASPFNISIRNIDGGNYIEGIYFKRMQQQYITSNDYDTNKTYIVGIGNDYLIPNPSFIYWKKGMPLYWNDTLQ